MKITIPTSGLSGAFAREAFAELVASRAATTSAFGECEIGAWETIANPAGGDAGEGSVSARDVVAFADQRVGLLAYVLPGPKNPIFQTLARGANGVSTLRTVFVANKFVAFYEISNETGDIVVTSGVADGEPESCLPFGLLDRRARAATRAANTANAVCEHLISLIGCEKRRAARRADL